MNNLIIIGAGGMGRVVFDTAKECIGYNTEFNIYGFIDDDLASLDAYDGYVPILDSIKNYNIKENDVFICSIGGTSRRYCMETIINRGGAFINLVHQTARIGSNVKMGIGNFIGPYSTIASEASIGDYNMFQQFVIVGHDCKIGSFNRFDSHVMCVGGIQIGDEVTIHTASVINHNVIVENRSKVGACSLVINDVKQDTVVFGNPARRLK